MAHQSVTAYYTWHELKCVMHNILLLYYESKHHSAQQQFAQSSNDLWDNVKRPNLKGKMDQEYEWTTGLNNTKKNYTSSVGDGSAFHMTFKKENKLALSQPQNLHLHAHTHRQHILNESRAPWELTLNM